MIQNVYSSQYGNVKYIEKDNIVLLTWKQKCSYDDYRNITLAALNALQKYKNSNFIIDARNGFEDEKEDVEWGFTVLLPSMSKTTCKAVVFIMEAVNDIEGEMDMWAKEFMKYFAVHKVTSYDDAMADLNKSMRRVITEALRNQFDSTFHMAHVLVKVCPEEVWTASFNEVPFWQQVFHYVYFIDFWMRETYDDSEWRTMIFDDVYTTDLYADSYEGLFISQVRMQEYLDAIQGKTTRIFNSMNDDKLSVPVYGSNPQYTYTDVILGQIRHIMYNIGYLNGILRELGLQESDWYAYNEPEGS